MILCSEYGGQSNTIICGFVCDTVDEVKDLPTTTKKGSGNFASFDHYANIGSTVTIGNNGSTKIMMLFSSGWQEI